MNTRKIECLVVDYADLNAAVRKTFNLKSFCCHLESTNDTDYLIEGITAEGFDESDEDTWQTAMDEGGIECWRIELCLQALCQKKAIEPGNYIVRVCW